MMLRVDAIDLRERLGPARDQGNRPTCLAFAATGGHELLRPAEPLAPEFLVWSAMAGGRDVRDGLRVADVRSTLETAGQCRESDFSYSDAVDPKGSGYGPPASAIREAAARTVTVHRRDPATVAIARGALLAGRAVVVILAVFRSITRIGADHVIPLPTAGEAPLGLHGLFVVGFDDNRAALLVRNSWGLLWGDQGHGWLPYAYPEASLVECWQFALT